MPRGGKRDKAGRKSSWSSGVKFEDTSLVRIPSYLKDKVLNLAHKLDAGDCIDLAQMQSQISRLKDENKKLKQQLQENKINLIVNDLNSFLESLQLKIKNWKEQSRRLRPVEAASSLIKILSELQSLINQERFKYQINTQVFNDSNLQEITLENCQIEKVTKSENHVQLDLLSDSVENKLSPLNNSQLASRLGLYASNLSAKRKKVTSRVFLDYTKSKDPEGVGWSYSQKNKLYFPEA